MAMYPRVHGEQVMSHSPQRGHRQNCTRWDIIICSGIRLFWSHLMMDKTIMHSIGIGMFVAGTTKLVAIFRSSLYYIYS